MILNIQPCSINLTNWLAISKSLDARFQTSKETFEDKLPLNNMDSFNKGKKTNITIDILIYVI